MPCTGQYLYWPRCEEESVVANICLLIFILFLQIGAQLLELGLVTNQNLGLEISKGLMGLALPQMSQDDVDMCFFFSLVAGNHTHQLIAFFTEVIPIQNQGDRLCKDLFKQKTNVTGTIGNSHQI